MIKNENNKIKKKRFYKVGQVVWSLDLKKEVTVTSINKDGLSITVVEKDGGKEGAHTFPLWRVDVLKYKAKKEFMNSIESKSLPKVFFAKVKENSDAKIPTKRDEDAGYDIYASLEGRKVSDPNTDLKVAHELLCPKGKTTLVPTGIAIALPKTHYFNTKHERGSTGKISLSVLSGVIDSGYRGEIFVALHPLDKDVLITNVVEDVTDLGETILYPYSKAICQGTIELVPQVLVEEISFEDLKNIKSERGDSKLGESGK